jgi:Zn-dependent protease
MFNMLPIPPLDGSKILTAFLPYKLQVQYRGFTQWVERYGLFAMFAFIFIFLTFLSDPFFVFVSTLVEFATGIRSL